MVNNVPASWTFSAFSIGRNALAYPAAAVLAGGNVRVGLEDNLYIGKGESASNAQLVEKAATVVATGMGARIIGPAEVREEAQAAEALRGRAMNLVNANPCTSIPGVSPRCRGWPASAAASLAAAGSPASCWPASMCGCSTRTPRPSASSARWSPMPSGPMGC